MTTRNDTSGTLTLTPPLAAQHDQAIDLADMLAGLRFILETERGYGESLYIGQDVTVTVLTVNGNNVRVGIEASRHVALDREEIGESRRRRRDDSAPDS